MQYNYSNLIQQLNELEIVPPKTVWLNIETQIQKESKKPSGFWFNRPQTTVLIIGLIFSGLFSAYMFRFISSDIPTHRLNSPNEIVFTQPQIIENTIQKNVENVNLSSILPSKNSELKNIENHKKVNFSNSSNSTKKYSNPVEFKKTIKANFENSKEIKGELISALPAVESKNGELKVYQNDEWITLLPIEQNEISSLKEPNMNLPALKEILQPVADGLIIGNNDVRESKGFYITPTLGANITQVYFNDPASNPFFSANTTFSGKFGYNAGFQLGYKFNTHWSIESGLFFSQNIQSFKEKNSNYDKRGLMYIDQLDIPLMARYSINFGESKYPKSISFKAGLIYNSVLQYQVNFIQKDLFTNIEKSYNYDADKRLYNSLQMGYIGGIDFDAFLNKRIALNTSFMSSFVSQLDNFPFFNGDNKRPLQFNSTISMGIKVHF